MRETRLQQLAAELIDRPVVDAPSVDTVVVRAAAYASRQRRQTRVLAVALVAMLLLSVTQVAAQRGEGPSRVNAAGPGEERGGAGDASDPDPAAPVGPTVSTVFQIGQPPSGDGGGAGGGGAGGGGAGGGGAGGGPPVQPQPCRPGANSGATDVGVTSEEVRLFLPVSGPNTDAERVVRAYVDRFNAEGGICGRTLAVVAGDDAPTDHADEVFASLASPLHEATDRALAADGFDRAGMPIVGLDGLSSLHYSSNWAWPVGTSAAAVARIAVRRAWDAGARTFAVVYDREADWGSESASALSEYVDALGGSVKASTGLDPAKASYASEANDFSNRCAAQSCDLVLLALHPHTATTWLAHRPSMGRLQSAGLPTLLTHDFGSRCAEIAGAACDGLMAWDPFTPPIGPFTDEALVAEYRSDAGGEVSPLTESAAVGVRVLVEALWRMGPNVTRSGLAAVLNSSRIDVGLSSPLAWTAADRRGNRSALGLTLQVAEGAFAGWEDAATGWRADPRL